MMVTLGRGDVYISRKGFESKARTNEALTKELKKENLLYFFVPKNISIIIFEKVNVVLTSPPTSHPMEVGSDDISVLSTTYLYVLSTT